MLSTSSMFTLQANFCLHSLPNLISFYKIFNNQYVYTFTVHINYNWNDLFWAVTNSYHSRWSNWKSECSTAQPQLVDIAISHRWNKAKSCNGVWVLKTAQKLIMSQYPGFTGLMGSGRFCHYWHCQAFFGNLLIHILSHFFAEHQSVWRLFI